MDYKIVIKYKKIKYLRARIVNDEVRVSAPYFTSQRTINNFLKEHEDFILKALKKNEIRKEQLSYNFDDEIEIFNKKYTILKSNKNQLTDSYIFIKEGEDFKKVISLLFKEMQLSYFKELTRNYYLLMNIDKPLPEVKIKDVKTRYGSYNRKTNEIVYASSLLFKDTLAYKYIVVHELSHMIEFNHSKAFYDIVSTYCPEYKMLQKMLKS